MAKVLEVKYYVVRNAFASPRGDYYLKTVAREKEGEKLYSFALFGLLEDGTIEIREEFDSTVANAHEFLEQVQQQCNEILKEEFEKAEAEYFEREALLNLSWKESDWYHKYYGIDVVTKEQRDIMDRVSRFLKRQQETRDSG